MAAPNNPFANINNDALKRYYAYGIRNSFGIAFDPVTGNLWNTENGLEAYDEINLVKPGFNSGWTLIMSPISRGSISQDQLINFPGSSYHDPILSWQNPVAITAIEFFKSAELGEKYKNNIFVGDYNKGNYISLNLTMIGQA